MKDFIGLCVKAAFKAGQEILEVYQRDFGVEVKGDNSPLTEADCKSHQIIRQILSSTNLPLLSEEGGQVAYSERKNWTEFWLVDPLDGTKEFIKKNGEFTVNIALIKNCLPVLGLVYVPVTKEMYLGIEGQGSFYAKFGAEDEVGETDIIAEMRRLPFEKNFPVTYTIIASRSHLDTVTEKFIGQKKELYSNVDIINSGSSIKLCLVASGKADVYPRLAPTMEWDTAAGHAVAKFAGCRVYDYVTGNELKYNKESLSNPWFIAEQSRIVG